MTRRRRITLATVLCGHCKAEGRRAERLGRVVKLVDGRVTWLGDDPTLARAARKRQPDQTFTLTRNYQTLACPWLNVTPPDTLDVWCRYHDHGPIPTSDVLGKRGTMWVTFKAAA